MKESNILFSWMSISQLVTYCLFISKIAAAGYNGVSVSWLFQVPYSSNSEVSKNGNIGKICFTENLTPLSFYLTNFRLFEGEKIIRGFSDDFTATNLFQDKCEEQDITISFLKESSSCKYHLGIFKGGSCDHTSYFYLCPEDLKGPYLQLREFLILQNVDKLRKIMAHESDFFSDMSVIFLNSPVLEDFRHCYELIKLALEYRNKRIVDVKSYDDLLISYTSTDEAIGDDCFENYFIKVEKSWRILRRIESLAAFADNNVSECIRLGIEAKNDFEKYIAFIKKCYKLELDDNDNLDDVKVFYESPSNIKSRELHNFYTLGNLIFIPCLSLEKYKELIFKIKSRDLIYTFTTSN